MLLLHNHQKHKEYNPIKGRSLMAHIRRTRHIMKPSHRSCFSFSIFNAKNNASHLIAD